MITLSFAANDLKEFNVAKEEYGAKTTAKKVIDDAKDTSERVKKFTVNFGVETKISKIDIRIVHATGRLIFKSTIDHKTVVLHEVEVNEKDDYVFFKLENKELNGVIVEWIPKDGKSLLTVVDFGAYTTDSEIISFYVDMVKPFLLKNGPPPETKATNDYAAGAEGDTTHPTFQLLPARLPVEYTVSPSYLPSIKR